MKNRILISIILIILGLLIALGPIILFPVCGIHAEETEHEMAKEIQEGAMQQAKMKCFWTARAELGIGILIAILGVLHFILKSEQLRIGLSIGAILNGVLALLIPNTLIGVCRKAGMMCRIGTLPALTIFSSLVIIVCTVNVFYLYRLRKKDLMNA